MIISSWLICLFVSQTGRTPIWNHGYTDAERLKSDDVGTYYVAYFTDITTEAKDVTSQQKSKARQKGARLQYYPKNFKFYRCSRGINKPDVKYKTYGDIAKEYGNPVYIKTYELHNMDKDEIVNKIQRESYKKQN